MKCVICHKDIEKQYTEDGIMYWDQGNNAEPIAKGRCCNHCNETVVMPQRITDMQMSLLEGGKDG